jgi:hypothetical protein
MSLAEMQEEAEEALIYAVIVLPAKPLREAGVELNSTEMVTSLSEEYADYADVFSEEEAAKLPESTRVRHAIPIEESAEVPYGPIYPLSANELRALREYIENNLVKSWIRPS